MPPTTKRRKVAATTSSNASSSLKPRGIDSFTRVSKASTTSKIISDKNTLVENIAPAELEDYSTLKGKRKIILPNEESALPSSSLEDRKILPLPSRSISNPKTPQKPILASTDAKSSDSSTKSARNLLNQLFVSSKTSADLLSKRIPSQALENTSANAESKSQDLPQEILDLINLHASFLTALSLHYAHNGTHSPADLRTLCPDIARTWGKRSVTVEDIRVILGILNSSLPPSSQTLSQKKKNEISILSLSDYGRGKICIEIKSAVGKAGRMPRPVDEDLFNSYFVVGVRRMWGERGEEMGIGEWMDTCPREGITICESWEKISPLLAKGQRRLEDMRKGITVRKEAAKEKKEGKIIVGDGKGARPTLLERLRAKQLHQSTLPAPLSKEQMGRKAALQRIEEVAGVLTMLSTSSSLGQQRISFTLPTVLGKLRDSFKTPMSKEEGETCVRLLASDVAPNWVKIVKMGKVEALVVNRDERPSELDIKERVKLAA